MKLKYETGVWNWSMKRLWNWSMEWWMQLNPTSTYFRCKHGLHARIHLCMNTWILYGCTTHDRLRQLVWNWCETDLKLTYNRPGCIYIYVIHILSYSFLGGKTLLSWRWAVHDELELEESDVSVLDSTRYMAAVMRCCFTRLCSWKRSCAKICCSSVSRRVVIWVTRCFCRSRRRASVFKGSGSFSGFWFL